MSTLTSMSVPATHIIVIAHNLRSCHNVGSLLRTAEGLGVEQVILSGYTPYPIKPHNCSHGSLDKSDYGNGDNRNYGHDESAVTDERLPHIAAKLSKQIAKTSLGAESMINWRHIDNIFELLKVYHSKGWTIAAIEQSSNSIPLPSYQPPQKLIIIVGREVEGIELEVLAAVDDVVEIPMFGRKESFNVVQAAAMALYHCRFAKI